MHQNPTERDRLIYAADQLILILNERAKGSSGMKFANEQEKLDHFTFEMGDAMIQYRDPHGNPMGQGLIRDITVAHGECLEAIEDMKLLKNPSEFKLNQAQGKIDKKRAALISIFNNRLE